MRTSKDPHAWFKWFEESSGNNNPTQDESNFHKVDNTADGEHMMKSE